MIACHAGTRTAGQQRWRMNQYQGSTLELSGCQMEDTSHSLLERVKTDDQNAWRQLLHVYGPLVVRWCERSGMNQDDSADILQEVFRSVSSGVGNFQPRRTVGSFRSWLKTITRTKIVDCVRRHSKNPVGRGGSTAQQQIASAPDPFADEQEDSDDAENENAIVVRRAMDLIKPEFSKQNWAAFEKIVIDGVSATDIAKQLGISPQAVRQANYRIRRRLRVLLEGLYDDV